MPRYKTSNGKRAKNIITHKAWFEIPVKSDVPDYKEAYLLPTKVANYIEKLENKIKKYERINN